MKMTVLDIPVNAINGQTDRLKKAIEEETRFGVGATFRKKREHDVMDEDWSFSRLHIGSRIKLGASSEPAVAETILLSLER